MKTKIAKLCVIGFIVAMTVFVIGTGLIVADGLNDRLGHADAALIFGNKVELNGTPSARLQARLDRAVELYRAGYFPSIIVSGGVGKEGYDEAIVMRDYLVEKGIEAKNVIVDSHGDNTFASAKNARQIMQQRKFDTILIVSQYYHISRARLALKRSQISTIYSAHARFFEPRDFYSSFRETVGWLAYALRRYD